VAFPLSFFIMKNKEIANVMLALNQRPIAVYPVYIHITGSVAGGVLLSQLMYWYSNTKKEFYKTDADFISETHLTVTEFRNAKKAIGELPFINIQRKGVPARTFYDVNLEGLLVAIHETSSQVTYEQGKRLPTNKRGGNLPTITENTHKNTTETTTTAFSNEKGFREIERENIGDVAAEFEQFGEPAPLKAEKKKSPPKLREAPPAAKEPTETYLMYEAWARFVESKGIAVSKSKTGNSYAFAPKDGSAIKKWREWCAGLPKATGSLEDWQVFLQAAWEHGGKWYQANFTPCILNSKRQELMSAFARYKAKNEPDMSLVGLSIEEILQKI
jgi:hypothetical protein